jgi:hypothetical protein
MKSNLRPRVKRSFKSVICAAALSVIGSHAHLAGADTSATWTVDANGDWGSTTKWSTPDAPRNNHPSTGDDYTAIINATGTKNYTVTIDDAPFTIDALTIDSAQATLLLQTNAITPGPVSIEAGIFELDGSTAGVDGSAIVVDPGGTLELFAGELNGGSATASGSGSSIIIDSGFTYSGGTTVQAVNGGLVILQSGNFTNNSSMPTASNNGIVSIGSGAIVDNTGATAGSSSTLQPGAGATLQLSGGTISGGTISSSGGTLLNASSGTLDGTPSGGITVNGTLQQNVGAITYLQGLINDPTAGSRSNRRHQRMKMITAFFLAVTRN